MTGNVRGLPPFTYVTRVVASRAAPGDVYAVFDGHRNDDFNPYIFASSDFGESWRQITSGLPMTSMNALAQHPTAHNLLFAGSEFGVHVSIDGGANWNTLTNGLPTVPVDDITVHPRDNDLVIGTHGLGIWIMDDIAPLQELSSEVMAAAAHLYPVRRATSYNAYFPQGWTPGIYVAPNPPDGAWIRYHLGADVDSVTLVVRDGDMVVRELDATTEMGLNQVMWDLRLVMDGPDDEPMGPGPRVLPGTYTVALTVGEETMEQPVEVRLDPRVTISRSDLMARHEAMLRSYRLSGPRNQAGQRMQQMMQQVAQAEQRANDAEEVPEGPGGGDRGRAGGAAGAAGRPGRRRRRQQRLRTDRAVQHPRDGGPVVADRPVLGEVAGRDRARERDGHRAGACAAGADLSGGTASRGA